MTRVRCGRTRSVGVSVASAAGPLGAATSSGTGAGAGVDGCGLLVTSSSLQRIAIGYVQHNGVDRPRFRSDLDVRRR